jgi:hypothetical protein
VVIPTRLRLGFVAALVTVVALPAAAARAQKSVHRSPHLEESANIVGFKVGPVAQFTEGGSALGGGISPFYERNLIPGWLEIEAAVAAVWVEEETVVAFEVLLKKPFHANEVVNPYAGLGPEVALLITPEGNRTRFGFKFVGGSYFWFREGPWGVDVEFGYVVVFDGHPIHEISLAAGIAARF